MGRNGVVTAAEILVGVPDRLIEYPLWRPGINPATAPWRRRNNAVAPCGTEVAYKRHRRHGQQCEPCYTAHATRAAKPRPQRGPDGKFLPGGES